MTSAQEILIRPAAAEDVPGILILIAPFVVTRQLLPRTREEVLRLTTNGFVAERGGQVVGFSAVEVYSPKLAEIQCLAVAEDAQRMGVGGRLIQECIERARELNVIELMAITASEKPFTDRGFHYSLPDQKKALFIQTRDPH